MKPKKDEAIYKEIHHVDDAGNRMIEKTVVVLNGEPVMFGSSEYYYVGVMGIPTEHGQQPHQYTFHVDGATTLYEAYTLFERQKQRGMKEEILRIKAEITRRSLGTIGNASEN